MHLLRICYNRGRVSSRKKMRASKKKPEKHVDFFSSCQRKEEMYRRTEGQRREVYSVLVFARVFLRYSLFTFFSHLPARRCRYRQRRYCCCSYQNNNGRSNSHKSTTNKCFQSTIVVLLLGLDRASCHFFIGIEVHSCTCVLFLNFQGRKKKKICFSYFPF